MSPETEDASIVFQPDRMIKQAKSFELRLREGAPLAFGSAETAPMSTLLGQPDADKIHRQDHQPAPDPRSGLE